MTPGRPFSCRARTTRPSPRSRSTNSASERAPAATARTIVATRCCPRSLTLATAPERTCSTSRRDRDRPSPSPAGEVAVSPNSSSSSMQASRCRIRSNASLWTRPSSARIRFATKWMWSLPLVEVPWLMAIQWTCSSKPSLSANRCAACCQRASLSCPSPAGTDTTRW